MISLAGRRPGGRQYERSSSEPNLKQPNYMAPLKRDYHIDPLSPDMLGPLIDLAYWSNFVEVRRDTAAALAALSMNSDNLSMMARAGALRGGKIPDFRGASLGRFPLVSADFWTSDRLSDRSRRVDAFSGTRARGTLTLKRR